jgi:exopolysaccharide biosynthesis polyprenyl glycosylphosphotransferase
MKKSEAIFGVLRLPLDALAVFAALIVSYRVREMNFSLFPGQLPDATGTLPGLPYFLSTFILPSLVVFLAVSAVLGLYTLRSTLSAWVEMGRVLLAAALWLVVIIAWYFLVLKQLFYSRALLLQAVVLISAFVVIGRVSMTLVQRAFLRAGIGRRVVVSVGKQTLAEPARATFEHDEHYRYLGHVADLGALRKFSRQQSIDLVIQTDPDPGSEETFALINECRSHQIGYAFLPPVLADVPHQLRVERLGLLPLIRFQPTPLDGWGRIAKRACDIVGSAVLFVLLSPVLLVIALAVIADTGWPVFYFSARIGEGGRRRIRILKFRSMVRDADKRKAELLALNHRRDGPLFKVRNDPRVTRTGRVLRRWTFDELPQLWNVFIGDLSLVGPRPHLADEVERYSPEQRRVFAVKPGMTGLAQVSGRSDLSFEEEVRFDLQYIEEWSLLLDLWVLWRTLIVVVSRKGAD